MVHGIVEWIDDKMDEATEENNYTKAFAAGVVEGLTDLALVYGFIIMACGTIGSVAKIVTAIKK